MRSQCNGCWCPGSLHRQVIDQILQEYNGPSTRRADIHTICNLVAKTMQLIDFFPFKPLLTWVNWTLRSKLQWNYDQNENIFIWKCRWEWFQTVGRLLTLGMLRVECSRENQVNIMAADAPCVTPSAAAIALTMLDIKCPCLLWCRSLTACDQLTQENGCWRPSSIFTTRLSATGVLTTIVCTVHHLIIIIVQTCLKALNL